MGEAEVVTLVIGLLITTLVAVAVFLAGRAWWPQYAGPAAFVVFLVGALLTLIAAL